MTLELKIPPVAVALVTGACMWLAAWAVPGFDVPFPGHDIVSGLLSVSGGFIALLGVVAFSRAGTTINPMKPGSSSSLVVPGIYSVTRNPMYLGLLLVLLAWAIHLANVLTVLFLPGFVWYMNRYQIEPEERALVSLFGPAFTAYAVRVRRWM
ncbi:MAG: isoprenylcysteine carboxylmethyltransferase family protein [Nitrospirota bacterium]|nr:isoprenylcysteine carboxylmethyltransferase family protein [Nitrospirota bacterium]